MVLGREGRKVRQRSPQQLLNANIAGSVSLREIAVECQLTPDHLSRAFKVSTGLTPQQCLQGQRVDRAKTMLATSGLPIAEIARNAGFPIKAICRGFSLAMPA
jgi:AraC family transcriptional regulator